MIVCPRCSKENQDHYKFCLGCGAELPRDAAHAPKSFTAPTPPSVFASPAAAPAPAGGGFGGPPAGGGFGGPPAGGGFGGPAAGGGFGGPPAGGGFGPPPGGGFGGPPAPAPVQAKPAASFGGAAAAPAPAPMPAPAPAAAGGLLTCPNCSNQVPQGFKFCGTCGYDMLKVQAATAPAAAPMPAATPMAAPAAATGPSRGTLVLIRPDGTEGESIPLGATTTPIGRDGGGLFASDSYLSPKHAVFTFKGAQLFVSDAGSLNGVYLRIDREVPTELEPGAIFRIGQEILRFEPIPAPARGPDGVEVMGSPNPGFLGKVSLLIGRDTTGNAFPIPPTGMHLGRERGDIIFPEDGYVSGLHCRIHSEGGKMMLTDVGSSNGTFVRVKGERAVNSGSMLLMGQQLFRAQY